MFLAVNQSLQNTSKKKRKRRTAEDDPQDDPAADGATPVPPLESSASSDQLVIRGTTCRVCKCPGRQSLALVYIYLGALTLILASLSIVFYTHTQDESTPSPVDPPLTTRAFRMQFQTELMRSEDELRALVNRILEEEQQLGGRWARKITLILPILKIYFPLIAPQQVVPPNPGILSRTSASSRTT